MTVELLDADGNVVASTTTDADGMYAFDGIECGTYTVRFSGIPEGSAYSPPNEGDDDAVDSDPTPSEDDPTTATTDPVEVTEDEPGNDTVEAGVIPAGTCSIGDFAAPPGPSPRPESNPMTCYFVRRYVRKLVIVR